MTPDTSRTLQRSLLAASAVLLALALVLPIWGMTLVSTQYPEGLRMIVYATDIRGDIAELNTLNRAIGMRQISKDFFLELRLLPLLFGVSALACLIASALRRAWATAVPLAMLAGTTLFGLWSVQRRLYQFGHELDPRAPMEIAPFTPPVVGQNQIAQFATYSYFGWGALLAGIAAALVCVALWLQLRGRGTAASSAAILPAGTLAA